MSAAPNEQRANMGIALLPRSSFEGSLRVAIPARSPNVLHDAQRRCKLCDFGTCLELSDSTPRPTEWIGSALYVAPEVDELKPYGLPADVFSFGVLAYELYHLCGTGIHYYGEGDMFEGCAGCWSRREPLLVVCACASASAASASAASASAASASATAADQEMHPVVLPPAGAG